MFVLLFIKDTPWYLHHSSGYYQASSTLRGSVVAGGGGGGATPPQRPLPYTGIPKRSRIDSSPGKKIWIFESLIQVPYTRKNTYVT